MPQFFSTTQVVHQFKDIPSHFGPPIRFFFALAALPGTPAQKKNRKTFPPIDRKKITHCNPGAGRPPGQETAHPPPMAERWKIY